MFFFFLVVSHLFIVPTRVVKNSNLATVFDRYPGEFRVGKLHKFISKFHVYNTTDRTAKKLYNTPFGWRGH